MSGKASSELHVRLQLRGMETKRLVRVAAYALALMAGRGCEDECRRARRAVDRLGRKLRKCEGANP